MSNVSEVTTCISMKDLAETTILAGVAPGRKVLARLMECTGREPTQPEPLFLDFGGIEIATASFLREAVLAFRDAIRNRRSKFYPVIANANDLIADELSVLVVPQGDVLMLCTLDGGGRVHQPKLVGDLDPKQRITFDLVQKYRETDASQLMRDYGESEGVQQTAWNNRLAGLANLGLIVELSQGRARRYRPLFGES